MSELGSLIELLGEEVTLKLVEAYGGTRRGVPKFMPEKHELRDLLGDAGFALLFQYFGGTEIAVPLAKRWRLELYAKSGLKTKEIARRAGYSERSVARILNGGGDQGQLSFSLEMPHR
jgi:AraC-like DNA-binding protein